jgi:hypothetical protein
VVIDNAREVVCRPPVALEDDKVVGARGDQHGVGLAKDDVGGECLLLGLGLGMSA